MSIKCPDCGHWNEDGTIFCEECGEPIDPKTRLMMELEGKKAPTNHSGVKKVAAAGRDDTSHSRRDDDDDDYIAPSYHEEEKKKFPAGLMLILVGIAGLIYFLFLR